MPNTEHMTSGRLLDEKDWKTLLPVTSSHWQRYFLGVAVFTLGFILSPLTWWNDLAVNLPIAWILASFLPDTWFGPAFVVCYWVTNIAGLMMMYCTTNIVRRRPPVPLSWRTIGTFLLVTTLFTILFLLLMGLGIIRPIDYGALLPTGS